MKTARMFFIVLFVCFGVWGQAVGETITKPNTFVSGTPAKAAEVNANFDTVYNQVNKMGGQINVDAANQKVGIGTAAPAEKLSVNGTIQSLIGGFKFPDGTSQATAFTGNADTVDSKHAADFATAVHTQDFSTITGIATDTQIPDTITVNQAANATNADTVDGSHASAFAPASHGHNALNAWDGDPANSVYVDSYGNVGIGTTVPTGKMDIRGDEVRVWDGTAAVNYANGQGDLYVEDDLEVDSDVFVAGKVEASGGVKVPYTFYEAESSTESEVIVTTGIHTFCALTKVSMQTGDPGTHKYVEVRPTSGGYWALVVRGANGVTVRGKCCCF